MAKITLPNGTIIEASDDVLRNILSGVEDGIHYNSSSQGRVKIKDMATPHLRNAILKSFQGHIDTARKLENGDLANYLRNGLGSDSITTAAMIKEFTSRRG